MDRPKRAAAAKPLKYTDQGSSGEEDDEHGAGKGGVPHATQASSRKSRSEAKDEDDAWSQGDDSDTAPAAKKRRTSTIKGTSTTTAGKRRAGKRRAGKLSAFQSVPLDLLVDIAKKLDPPTLLSLSRVNKLMRRLFASRSAAPVWASVCANVDLPALESTDLSGMQLTSLITSATATSADAGGPSLSTTPSGGVGASLNKACRLQPHVKDLHPLALECSLFTYDSISGYNRDKKPYYCIPDLQAMSDHLHNLEIESSVTWRNCLRDARLRKRNEQAMATDQALDEDAQADELAVGGLEAFAAERASIVAAAQKDAGALVDWERSLAKSRRDVSYAARAARSAAIKEKLFALGYTESDCSYLHYHSSDVGALVHQPTRLSDTIWNRISSEIIASVERNKAETFIYEKPERLLARRTALQPRYDALLSMDQGEANTTFPSFGIVTLLPSVEPFWVPEDSSATNDEWQAALPSILAEVDSARRAIKVGFARHLVAELCKPRSSTELDAALVDKLKAPSTPGQRVGALLHAFEPDETHGTSWRWSGVRKLFAVALDLSDAAPKVSAAEFDALFSHSRATFNVGSASRRGPAFAFPEIHAQLCSRGYMGLAREAPFPLPPRHAPSIAPRPAAATLAQSPASAAELDAFKRNVLSSAGPSGRSLDDGGLKALGKVFACDRCPGARMRCWTGVLDHYGAKHAGR